MVVVVEFVCCSERGNKQTIETYLLQFGKSERNMYGRMDGWAEGFCVAGHLQRLVACRCPIYAYNCVHHIAYKSFEGPF